MDLIALHTCSKCSLFARCSLSSAMCLKKGSNAPSLVIHVDTAAQCLKGGF